MKKGDENQSSAEDRAFKTAVQYFREELLKRFEIEDGIETSLLKEYAHLGMKDLNGDFNDKMKIG